MEILFIPLGIGCGAALSAWIVLKILFSFSVKEESVQVEIPQHVDIRV